MWFRAHQHSEVRVRGCTSSAGKTLLACLVLALSLGCDADEPAANAEADAARITSLTLLYTSYMNSHGRVPPASEAEFKQYIAETDDRVLGAAGVSTVDELFVSPRDNEPYVVLYGREAAKLISRGIVAHERKGKDGRRLVGYRMGFVNEVEESEFRKLVPPS
jgi:hypothetical protein